jgi:hypothetical protein
VDIVSKSRLLWFRAWTPLAVFWLVAIHLWAADPNSHASAQDPTPLQVRLGVDGHIRLGCWTELQVHCREAPLGGELIIRAIDGDANWASYHWPLSPVPRAASGSRDGRQPTEPSADPTEGQAYVGLFRLGRSNQPIEVTIRDAAQKVWARTQIDIVENPQVTVHAANDRIWVYLGPDLNLNRILGWSSEDRQTGAYRLISVSSPDRLPSTAWGWEAVERVVACPDGQRWPRELTDAQVLAMSQWLVGGGRLSLALAQSWPDVLGEEGRLQHLLPNLKVAAAETRDSSQIELLVSSRSQLIKDPRTERLPLAWFDLDRRQAPLLIDGRPVLVRLSSGLGQVDLLGLDPADELLAAWPSRGALLTRWLDYKRGDPIRLSTGLGYQDVSGRMRSALEQFTNVSLINFTAVALIVLGFVALLVADYFFLRHVVGGLQWTWVTLPVYCLVACLATWALFRSSKPADFQVNQAEIIDIDATGGFHQLVSSFQNSPEPAAARTGQLPAYVHGRYWASVYSPVSDAVDLELSPSNRFGFELSDRSLGWLGLPGSAMGGMQSLNRLAGAPKNYDIYGTFQSVTADGRPRLENRIQGLPFYVASSRITTGDWTAPFGTVESDLRRQAGRDRLVGTITNPLSVELKDCFIVYGTWAYRLNRPLGPGETVDLDVGKNQAKPESFDDWLRRPNSDPDDLHRVLELLMYFEQAGGLAQTRLTAGYQGRIDFSHLSRLDRAVLIGKFADTVAGLRLDGQDIQPAQLDRRATAIRLIVQGDLFGFIGPTDRARPPPCGSSPRSAAHLGRGLRLRAFDLHAPEGNPPPHRLHARLLRRVRRHEGDRVPGVLRRRVPHQGRRSRRRSATRCSIWSTWATNATPTSPASRAA